MVVISHGEEGKLFDCTHKQQIRIDEDIIDKVCSVESLKGKPKVFIFQSCRGGTYNYCRFDGIIIKHAKF